MGRGTRKGPAEIKDFRKALADKALQHYYAKGRDEEIQLAREHQDIEKLRFFELECLNQYFVFQNFCESEPYAVEQIKDRMWFYASNGYRNLKLSWDFGEPGEDSRPVFRSLGFPELDRIYDYILKKDEWPHLERDEILTIFCAFVTAKLTKITDLLRKKTNCQVSQEVTFEKVCISIEW